jgi:hypothetical protein
MRVTVHIIIMKSLAGPTYHWPHPSIDELQVYDTAAAAREAAGPLRTEHTEPTVFSVTGNAGQSREALLAVLKQTYREVLQERHTPTKPQPKLQPKRGVA